MIKMKKFRALAAAVLTAFLVIAPVAPAQAATIARTYAAVSSEPWGATAKYISIKWHNGDSATVNYRQMDTRADGKGPRVRIIYHGAIDKTFRHELSTGSGTWKDRQTYHSVWDMRWIEIQVCNGDWYTNCTGESYNNPNDIW